MKMPVNPFVLKDDAGIYNIGVESIDQFADALLIVSGIENFRAELEEELKKFYTLLQEQESVNPDLFIDNDTQQD